MAGVGPGGSATGRHDHAGNHRGLPPNLPVPAPEDLDGDHLHDGALALLTSRELEVLRHLAMGRSNAEIAKALFVSEATVKSHVARMLSKLGLSNRVQAARFAYQHGLRDDPTI
jgi:DNA-binding NarL/FixJ family response regulator